MLCLLNLITQGDAERAHWELLSAENFLNNLGETADNRSITRGTPKGEFYGPGTNAWLLEVSDNFNMMIWAPAPWG